MTLQPEDIGALSRLLDEALPLTPADRVAWLAALPAACDRLRPYLEDMLARDVPHELLASRLPTLPLPGAGDSELLREGVLVGPYRLLRELGRGGMGCVWLAEAHDGTARVALKLPRLSWVAGMERRMARERAIGARLVHPNIVRLLDAGVDARGWPWLAFEHVEGQPVDRWCQQRSPSVADRVALVLQVADAVTCAHGQQVIHRDLKPSNVLVSPDGSVHLLDFGIARLLDEEGDDGDATRTHGRAMTPTYASPEQILGTDVSFASDVYSLGVLAYELLTGVKPFRPQRDTAAALEEAILNSEVGPASARAASADAPCLRDGFDAVIAKAMQREAEDRYASVAGFADDLRRALAGKPVGAAPVAVRDAWYQFGSCELSAARNVLWVDDKPRQLTSLAAAALVSLIQRGGQALTLGELRDTLPPSEAADAETLRRELTDLIALVGEAVIEVTPGPAYRLCGVVRNDLSHVARVEPRGYRTNLPATLPPILGREEDLSALDGLLQRHRVVSVVAPGGMGKSTLAQHALHRRRGAYRHGICWVELATVLAPGQVTGAISDALGLRGGPADAQQNLLASLQGMEILLCLDNAEYVIDAVARTVQLIVEEAAGVSIVVTSQLPLNLGGLEQVYRLGPLATPEALPSLDQAARYGAIALFAARAAAADHEFRLDERNLAVVTDICRRLEGLPLAIELAAARVHLLGEPGLAQALGEPLRVLTAGKRLAPRRQTTLRAALEWSHGLLSHNERVVFRRLSVFSGSFTLAMAEEVVPDDGDGTLDRWAVVQTVGALVERSLVAVLRRDAATGQARYRLLESPKAFAAEQLAEHPTERERICRRHAAAVLKHFAAVEQAAWDGRIGIDPGIALLEPDLDNARTAMAWLLEHDHVDAVRLAPVMSFALTYDRFEESRRMWDATRALLRAGMPAAARQHWYRVACYHYLATAADRVELSKQAMHVLKDTPDRRSYLFACAIHLWAAIVSNTSAEVRADARRTMTNAMVAPLHGHLAVQVDLVLGIDAGNGNRYADAHVHLRRVVTQAVQSSFRFGRLSGLISLAYMAHLHQDWKVAKEITQQVLGMLDASRDAYHLMNLKSNLLALLVETGDEPVSDAACRETLQLARRFGVEYQTIDALMLRCAIEGRFECSARINGYADAIYESYNYVRELVEVRMVARARALAIANLGDAEFERLHEAGRALTPGEVDELIFGR